MHGEFEAFGAFGILWGGALALFSVARLAKSPELSWSFLGLLPFRSAHPKIAKEMRGRARQQRACPGVFNCASISLSQCQ